MATAFKVFYDRQVSGTQVAPKTTFSKAECEEKSFGKLTHAVTVVGPVECCSVCELEAETEAEAVQAARFFLGAKEGEGELLVATAANVKKKSAR